MAKEINRTNICLCGDGWGALAALNGLALKYSDCIVVTNDEIVNQGALDKGFRVAADLMQVDANIYLCAGFTQIFNEEFLRNRCVLNIHYSLLPKYRGLHSTVWAMLNDEPYFGLSIHEMNQFIDDGPIYYQYKIPNIGQTSLEVMEECNRHISQNLSEIIGSILEGKLEPVEQNAAEATWGCKRNEDDCIIDFDQNIEYLRLFFRALVEPYPLPRVLVNNKLVEVVKSEFIISGYYMQNGRVVNIENERVWIKVGNGFMIVTSVRDAKTKEFLLTSDLFKIGQRLK